MAGAFLSLTLSRKGRGRKGGHTSAVIPTSSCHALLPLSFGLLLSIAHPLCHSELALSLEGRSEESGFRCHGHDAGGVETEDRIPAFLPLTPALSLRGRGRRTALIPALSLKGRGSQICHSHLPHLSFPQVLSGNPGSFFCSVEASQAGRASPCPSGIPHPSLGFPMNNVGNDRVRNVGNDKRDQAGMTG